MARSVADFLRRFDEPRVVAPLAPEPVVIDEPLIEAEETEPREPIVELTDELRDQLVEEGRAAAKEECEELIARERAASLLRLETERRSWAREEGERLGEQFRSAFDRFVEETGADVGRVLEPFVTGEVRERMVEALVDRLRVMIADREHPVVRLCGPTDLLDSLCEKLGGEGVATRIEDVGGVDVRARLDATTIETSLEDWMRELHDEDGAQ
ncbi:MULTISPECIES: hypothetical protein [Methylosinus]|uniref:Flagellar assembly protein FliH/Type III secretion system HrpE domain-containing protein n=1 Tax=Methylosinus trichosporium (strain ATCC 35070 / NCIMB 11131 / UNIQEM 75 / OB3b) TaxID=595536 RepID=A0A2D2D3U8_METT3|nr:MULTISPECIES: hypothetical protein [Methylosinus]ATQ69673.1 hypothetical protein CQW49_18645 [Methylosinus trichosporium OB3b]OBS51239.1 hypothetical protein A8B73_17450 [Methylosinus sp. 3S-1]